MLPRLYVRFGTGYLALVLAWLGVLGLVGGALSVEVASRLLGQSFHPPLTLLGMVEAGVTVGCGIPFAFMWGDVRPLVGWIHEGRPPAGARVAWQSGVTAVRRALPRCFGLVSVGLLPAVAWAVGHYGLGVVGLPVAWLYTQFGIAVTAAYMAFVGESMMRPMVEDAARAAPAGSGVRSPQVRVGQRVLLALAVTTAFAVLVGQAVGSVGSSPTSCMLGAVGLAAGVALCFTPVLIRVVTDSVVGPVRTLTAATARAAAGELEHPVPVTSDDELGVLVTSFNDMLGGLREREELRGKEAALTAALRQSLEDLERRAEELRTSRARVVAAADVERRRMERDLHDGAQQRLVLLGLDLGAARRLIGHDPAAASAAHAALQADLRRALAELRDLAHGIYSTELETEGLPAALRDAATRAALPTTLRCDGVGRHPRDAEAAIYFCCLEALQNAAKHAGSTAQAVIHLREEADRLVLEVADDGRGCDAALARAGAGQHNMADRVGALGGTVSLRSAPGSGTTVTASVPLRR